MTKGAFLLLLRHASCRAYNLAGDYVFDELPMDFQYSVALNVSSDHPHLPQFDIYPEDNGRTAELINEFAVVDLLCRKGKVPVWIDISVERVHKRHTVFTLLCAGRYSDDEKEFYYRTGATGPFGIKSPVLPYGFVQGRRFKLGERKGKSWFRRLKN